MPRLALAVVVVLAAATTARADTVLTGGVLPGAANTWTLAGSPYLVSGDVTVPMGATLTIEAGVEVRATANQDMQGSGSSPTRVELIVDGTLHVAGTAAQPVTFDSSTATAGSWYGIELTAKATDAQLTYANVVNATYGVTSLAPNTELHTSHLTITTASSYGLWLRAGTPTLDTVTTVSIGTYGVYITDAASPTLTNAVIRGSGSIGVYVATGTAGQAIVLTNCTINANGSYGVYSSAASGTSVTIASSIITNQGYGVYRADTAAWSVTSSNVWGNSSANYQNVANGTGTISANPLYVSSTDLRLTSNSPSRFGAAAAADQGALPYDGVATPGLYGTLWANTSLTAAGSPYTAAGDLTIAPGVTLTVEAGTTLNFASNTDLMGAGASTTRGELIVRGKLAANATPASPITIASTVATSGSWYGVELDPAATGSVIDNVIIRRATYALVDAATGANAISHVTADAASSYGFWLRAGTPTLDGLVAQNTGTYGVYITDAASPTITNAVIRGSGSIGVYVATGTAGQAIALTNCTINANGSYGVYSSAASGTSVTIASTIITNQGYGVYRADTAAWSVTSSNVWGNSSANYQNVANGTGTISANPLYVSSTDLRLTSNSPSRFGTAAAADQGALPYDGVATPGLYGTLWVNTSLAAAGSPYTAAGDLTIAPGVTLTVEAGTTLNFASNTDLMGAGASTTRGELIVRGKLVADGALGSPITFGSTVATSGSWYGVELDAGATNTVLDYVTITRATYALVDQALGANTITHVTADAASSYGFWLRAGTPALDGVIAQNTGTYGVYITDAASPTITNAVIRGSGSIGVYVATGTAGQAIALTNCTINANGSYGVYSSAASGTSVTIANTIITNQGYGVYRADTATWSVTYSDVWNNSSANYQNVANGTGTISANPQFVSTTDLHLQGTSVAIDTGTTGPNHDADGYTRPLDGNGLAGAQYDLGAYEFVLAPMCGNGAVEPGETCDSGVHNGMYGYCNATCTAMGPRCGDGTTNGPEECDDANTSNTDACTNACLNAKCGDGYLHAGAEQCDDGNSSNTDACTNTCTTAKCGDGFVQAGEECDDGNAVDTDACLHTCVAATCGDGLVEVGVEQCDDGNHVDTDACLNTCTTATCGDGVIETGVETCDDGNTIATDGCTATCHVATCGDGVVQAGVEMCDDGNTIDTDACRATCVPAACGDGVLEVGVEACDDGNTIDTDACNNHCVSTTCGDGVVQPGVEQCDDANKVETDGCRNNCTRSACGDGVVWAGVEECDDGNVKAGDGCSPACTVEDAGGADTTTVPPSPSGGCCETENGGAGSLALGVIVLGLVRRRRRA